MEPILYSVWKIDGSCGMTNDEALMTKEARNPNAQGDADYKAGVLYYEGPVRASVRHSFVISASSFVIPIIYV